LRIIRRLEPVNRADIGVIQRGKQLGFTLDACQAMLVRREALGQNSDRHVAVQGRVMGSIHFPHAADPLEGQHFIRTHAFLAARDIFSVRGNVPRS